jgi:hypothetical protein
LLVRQADLAVTAPLRQLALLETAESVGLAALAIQVR